MILVGTSLVKGMGFFLYKGFHPDTNPWVKDEWEEYLLKWGYLRCIGIPTTETQYDQMTLELLHMSILG